MRHHTGSGRRTAIAPDFETHHRPALAGTRTAMVSLRQVGTTRAWNPATKQTETTALAAYAVGLAARIQELATAAQRVEAALDDETISDFLVALDAGAAANAQAGHLIDVTASSDPQLTGRTLRVDRIVRGSLRFERHLFASYTD